MISTPRLTIATVLPHVGRMLLLDELLDHGPEHVSCGVTIRSATMFCDGVNGVPAWVGLEYLAQACCAFSGIEDVRAGGKPGIALLLGSRSYQSEAEWFPLGAALQVRVELQMRDESGFVAFAGTIEEAGRVLARGDVKAYRPKDVLAVIRGSR
jgi:predicted hotdog family 3-hydroxylacyl-ACP dehydratase